jgi:hypothetical protein
MSLPSPPTIVGATTGTAGVSFPWWGELLEAATGANQVLVALLGIIVLTLTAYKLVLEILRLRRERR